MTHLEQVPENLGEEWKPAQIKEVFPRKDDRGDLYRGSHSSIPFQKGK